MVWRKGQLEGITFDGLLDSAGLGLFEQGETEIKADDFCLRESFLEKETDIA